MNASTRPKPVGGGPALAHDGGARHRGQSAVYDWSLGELLRQKCQLTDEQVAGIVAHQREHKVRFGEAAVALKLATSDDVLQALSQQFHYAYAPALAARAGHTELVAAAHPFGDESEAFRELRSHLMMGVLASEQRRAIAVLSPNVGDGKTYIAANLAVAFSQLGGRTLLIDADMRTPRQHRVFGFEPTTGLSSVLSDRTDGDVIRAVPDLPCLFVMPVGAVPPNPLELVQRPTFGLLIQELLNKFDHVVVDTPAASHGADARVVAAQTGAALVVGRAGRSRIDALQSLLKSLGKGPAAIAGVVYNEY